MAARQLRAPVLRQQRLSGGGGAAACDNPTSHPRDVFSPGAAALTGRSAWLMCTVGIPGGLQLGGQVLQLRLQAAALMPILLCQTDMQADITRAVTDIWPAHLAALQLGDEVLQLGLQGAPCTCGMHVQKYDESYTLGTRHRYENTSPGGLQLGGDVFQLRLQAASVPHALLPLLCAPCGSFLSCSSSCQPAHSRR